MAVSTSYLPKHVDRPHYEVTIPDQMHQFDLLYMPRDTLYGNKYKYILSGINVASRSKVARQNRRLLQKHELTIPRVTTKYKHTHTAFVEALNKILAEQLFKVQDVQELNDPE